MDPLGVDWEGAHTFEHKSYQCGYCGKVTGVRVGYRTVNDKHFIYVCGGCGRPTFFEAQRGQIPAPILGSNIEHLPEDIGRLYDEARKCTQVNSFTSCVLTCRKILMHIAVEKGADKNKSFLYYVNYLVDNHFVPPDGRGWVDHIRDKGNEANHEIVVMSSTEAFELLSFSEMLLKFIYEFPARIMPREA